MINSQVVVWVGGGADGLTFIDRDRQLFKFVL
jgi:hypothetical protein